MKKTHNDSDGVWDWRATEAARADELIRRPARRRKRSLIQAAMMTAAALLFSLGWNKSHPAMVLFTLAGLTVFGGWLAPPLYRAIEKILAGLVHALGLLLAWFLLAPFFYLCFTLGRLVWRIQGADRLQLRFPGKTPSEWHAWKGRDDPEQYRKQY